MKNYFDAEVKVPEEKAISLLNDLIKIPCFKGVKNDGIINFLEKELQEIDCKPEVFVADSDKFWDYVEHCPDIIGKEKSQKYISGVIKGSGGGKSMLIYAHLDTMDLIDSDSWYTDPFRLIKRGDKLHGLGTADSKSTVAAGVIALKIIKEMGIQLKGDVKFIAENEKDMGSTGPLEVFKRGCNCDGALYLHPPESGKGLGDIKVRAHGIMTFRITTFGEKPALLEPGYNPTNYANIKDGTNAIYQALKVLKPLMEYAEKRDKKYNKENEVEKHLFNIGSIKGGGEIPGVVADRCVIEGHFVFNTKETAPELFKEMETHLYKAIEGDKSFDKCPLKIENFGKNANPASITAVGKGDAIVQTIKSAFELEGCPFSVLPKHPTSAIRFPMIFEKTPTVGLGPLAGNFSSPNEWVSEEDYYKTIKVLVNTIIDWCK